MKNAFLLLLISLTFSAYAVEVTCEGRKCYPTGGIGVYDIDDLVARKIASRTSYTSAVNDTLEYQSEIDSGFKDIIANLTIEYQEKINELSNLASEDNLNATVSNINSLLQTLKDSGANVTDEDLK